MKKFSDLKHRLVIRQPAQAQDPLTGELIDNPALVLGTVWARIEPLRGTELMRGEQILSKMDTRIVVRCNPVTNRITQAHSGECNGIIYDFVSVKQIMLDQRYIEIMAKSGLNNG